MNENLEIYNKCRVVPAEAQKPIKAGRLSGMTDINPMWRIKKMTELFGICGEGWGYEISGKEFVPGADGTIAVFVDVQLWYKRGEEKCTIPGTGGSMYVAKESKGLYTDDEAVKKATTDAISVACKALGIGADVYWDKDKTKYANMPSNEEFIRVVNDRPAEEIELCTRVQVEMIKGQCSSEQVKLLCEKYKVQVLEDIPRKTAAGIISGLNKRKEA